jgi:hypothetical protein
VDHGVVLELAVHVLHGRRRPQDKQTCRGQGRTLDVARGRTGDCKEKKIGPFVVIKRVLAISLRKN